MVTVTDDGLEWWSDKALDNEAGRIDYIQVGSGSGNEANGATALASPEYSSDYTGSNVDFVETSNTGEFEAVIRLKGGTEVPAGTDISEIGVFSGDPTAGGILIVIDEFAAVTMEDGHTEEFYVTVTPQR